MTDNIVKLANVLVIDDDEISNFIYTRVISSTGAADNIKSCMSGGEALQYLEDIVKNQPEEFPKLIFLDINMPVMNGWDFLNKYQKIVPKEIQDSSTLCILSSSVYKDDIDKAHTYPQVSEYVPKPLTSDSLKILLKKYFKDM
ncbi:response regulator [Fulvivirga sp. RKSG066]|uniref:response regulator n=1 Tax=Fulvivirga aurantia TaxID=2529383 RepID=UPI0012BBFC23|nr:response regulator [Fulvivirga aurantia]MTI22605.1 response regulator [Fulvivirga aurantia]